MEELEETFDCFKTEHFHQTGWGKIHLAVIQLSVTSILNHACTKIFLSRFVSKGFQLLTLLQRQNAFPFKGSTAWITPKIIELAKDIRVRRVLTEIAAFTNAPLARLRLLTSRGSRSFLSTLFTLFALSTTPCFLTCFGSNRNC
jgi:hypothetical protein